MPSESKSPVVNTYERPSYITPRVSANENIRTINTITDFHRWRGLPKPLHPLISLVDYSLVRHYPENNRITWVQNFYSIGLKRNVQAKLRYGQQVYDFDEGLMSFIAPGQIFSIEVNDLADYTQPSGWLLLIHPDFLWNTPLATGIKKYDFFGYNVNESLFLSDKEESIVVGILSNIEQEYRENIDKFSQSIIVSQIETLLNYAERFYQRQFITRGIANHEVLGRLTRVLEEYFNDEESVARGLPSVQFVAEAVNLSPNYLSDLLKSLTGKSTQHHIHDKLIEKAKEKLSATRLSVSEIAYALGFEHPQSFSKLFKAKTNQSPLEFRASFHN